MREFDIIIVGAGHGGAQAAVQLRQLGFDGSIAMIGEEPELPYERPPLSKDFLAGEKEFARMLIRPEAFWLDRKIEMLTGQEVTALDPEAQVVTTAAGDVLGYGELIWATGGAPRKLRCEGHDLAGIHAIRTRADVETLKTELGDAQTIAIVGGGYIGLEAAAVARKLDLEVTVLEMAPRILQRVAAPETSDYIRALHQAHGVTILESTGLDRLLGTGHVSGVRLQDGRELPADFVIAGVGIIPGQALAEAAGLEIENGIKTDAHGRTSDPFIWSAGDCASFPWKGGRIRLESVGNAIDQSEVVAENILGAGKDYIAKPWFWSDQYACKLQIAGLNTGYDNIVTRGPEGEGVSFWYYQGDTLLAVDAMNDPRGYMVGKRLIEAGKSPDKAKVADLSVPLKDLLSA
jgi:3-phenylpropionate/trans-cinnamate dioxygenase ferredoxin reductase subunit